MRDKVVLGVTLAIVLLLTLVIYGVIDSQRATGINASNTEAMVTKGQTIYAQYCIQCHGPRGEGCIGPALNRVVWRPTTDNGLKNTAFDDGSHDFMKKVISRGRASNQPGEQMPAWLNTEGGALNDEEIESVIAFIQYGSWDKTLEGAPSATNLNEPLPTYAGFDDVNQVARVKEVMLSKGCLNCHTLGKGGGKIAADLTDVGSRRSADWIRRWIQDPPAMPASERGPNLFLVAPTVTVPVAGVPTSETVVPASTPQLFPMNNTFMPKLAMTDDELNLLVDYLSKARTTSK
ncbi:MAG TPA: c-type cytochrome [Chloroflexia bacterium]|nr:c-type cytochrome [Chloroflexia bacterium]